MENYLVILKDGKKIKVQPIDYGEIVIKYANGVPVYITKQIGEQIK
ncbi:TPA: hypothetical protein ACWP80_001540 [Enterococcus faecium]